MIKKNDILDLTIEDLGVNGEGIGKVDGYALFVKDAVIGDVVKVKDLAIAADKDVVLATDPDAVVVTVTVPHNAPIPEAEDADEEAAEK